MPSSPLLPKLEHLISGDDVCRRLNFSRQTLRRLVRDQKFPAPIHVSKARLAWRLREVEAWVAKGGLQQYLTAMLVVAVL